MNNQGNGGRGRRQIEPEEAKGAEESQGRGNYRSRESKLPTQGEEVQGPRHFH